MKKFLSIILAILMIVATMPMAFAAESDGVKTTLDVSKGEIIITDTYVTQNGENIELDPDGYIITGESYGVDTVLQIKNNSGNELTLDIVFKNVYIRAKAYSTALRVDGSSTIVLNVAFEGENTISPYNHPVFAGTYSAVKTINITYDEDSVPNLTRQDSKSYKIYNTSNFIVNINGEPVGYDGHVHEKSDEVQTCKGYKCAICNMYYGEKGDHILEEQNCKGYRCTTCTKYFGEPGDHIKGKETCLGAVCEICNKFYGEKYENAHDWSFGYCRYCDEKMPDDAQCSHKFFLGGCYVCGEIDETSEDLVIEAYFNGVNFNVFQARLSAFYKLYGMENVKEFYKTVKKEEKMQQTQREDIFMNLEGTVGENKAAIEELMAADAVFADKFKKCLEGVHNVDEYISNNDATCLANGTKTGACTFCNEKYVTVEDENTMFDSCYTNDGDAYCDGCGEQLICEACGRPVHEDTFIQNLVCLIVMFINLVKSMF